MSRRNCDPISRLKRGKYDYKIKVQVIRNWRGATTAGELFKAFNVILIDQEDSKIHAFIPGKCADQHDLTLRVGQICLIKNFTVQKYKEEDKFRPVHNENQLIFSAETIIKEVEEKGQHFDKDGFDFYDHSELEELADKTPHLIDVVGIIQNRETIVLRDILTRMGRNQFQTKFQITDGSSNITITLWDTFAQKFYKDLLEQEEDPVIIILSCCRCGTWNKQLDLSNVAATKHYLNYNHHSVKEIRKMLCTPEFTQKLIGKQIRKKAELHTIAAIKTLGVEYVEAQVVVHANIKYVEQTGEWYYNICMECNERLKMGNGAFICETCKRRIPHPEKKFQLNVVASDETGGLEIILEDREVRILTGTRAEEVYKEYKDTKVFPKVLKNLAKMNITAQLIIKQVNIAQKESCYLATNVCQEFYIQEEETPQESEMLQESSIQPSTSSYHLAGISGLNFE